MLRSGASGSCTDSQVAKHTSEVNRPKSSVCKHNTSDSVAWMYQFCAAYRSNEYLSANIVSFASIVPLNDRRYVRHDSAM